MIRVLKQLKDVLQALDSKVDESEVTDDKGQKFPSLTFTHGTHTLIAMERPNYVTIIYPMNIKPEDADLVAKQPEETQELLFSILKREMAEGRSGYSLSLEGEPKKIRQIRIEQRIVVAAIRCQLVLGQAFRDLRSVMSSAGSASTPHPFMYR